jgi:cell division protein FtsB
MAAITKQATNWNLQRVLFPLTVVTAVALLVASFPLATLWHQTTEINAVSHHIAQSQQAQATLASLTNHLATKQESVLLARSEYQLVQPGERLIQVVPTNATTNSLGNGDPANDALVSPATAQGFLTNSTLTPRATPHAAPGLLSRLVRTLEFWR